MKYSKIFIANDHSSVESKNVVRTYLENKGYEVVNLGTNSNESVNYVDYADKCAISVLSNPDSLGIVICGTGVGVSIAANKHKGIRCALLYNDSVAKLAKQHNNANIIAFGGREMNAEEMLERLNLFLESEFEGGRHINRINSME